MPCRNYYETILNYFVNRETNAFAESFNAKIKAFRAQFRGVGDIHSLCSDYAN
ncbi:transposase [Bacteroides muris (ex Fokt et al. 2023)]|uniref:transposase n=1 Tax=Bacteroides muris (ex Fokt et al. 2023) TaxID=2937417 RepID=UPI003AF324DA